MKTKKTISRRKFMSYLISGALAVETVWFLFHSSGHRDQTKKKQLLIDAGAIDSCQTKQIYPFTSGKFNLIRYADGSFMALSTVCTHLGCIVNTNTDKNGFSCPCHSSAFDKHGEVLESPATRPLDTYPIIFKEGHIWVDVSKPIKRQKFDPSQLYKA